MATSHTATRPSRLRSLIGLGALAEVVVYVLAVSWVGLGWTLLATVATSALGGLLLARQGRAALGELRLRAQEHRAPGRALGDAGLVALGGVLMVLPGFIGDLLGLLCLLPFTRALPRALLGRLLLRNLPDRLRGPVHVRAVRTEPVSGPAQPFRTGATRVIEGEIAP
jgi:UPF0716 protein FxsA